jgi:hypothetical protein
MGINGTGVSKNVNNVRGTARHVPVRETMAHHVEEWRIILGRTRSETLELVEVVDYSSDNTAPTG